MRLRLFTGLRAVPLQAAVLLNTAQKLLLLLLSEKENNKHERN